MTGKKTSAAAPPEGEPQSKQQRTSHKAENKLWLIEHKAKNPALGYPELCAAYKNKFNRSINKSQVCKWLKKANDLKALPKKAAKGICRLKAQAYQELEDIVVKYYRQIDAYGGEVDNDILLQKAIEAKQLIIKLAKKKGNVQALEDKYSNWKGPNKTWVQEVILRRNLVMRPRCGEAAGADHAGIALAPRVTQSELRPNELVTEVKPELAAAAVEEEDDTDDAGAVPMITAGVAYSCGSTLMSFMVQHSSTFSKDEVNVVAAILQKVALLKTNSGQQASITQFFPAASAADRGAAAAAAAAAAKKH